MIINKLFEEASWRFFDNEIGAVTRPEKSLQVRLIILL